ncbi:hypothetical protein [Acidisoma sp. S159]|uniref:hypothetical protein n=1 Tax=Acidisoma sp. S159 TaxID=1747225 RepID=UPI00131E4663|nr:hypothetical protein [Acidisoma sp. S159]
MTELEKEPEVEGEPLLTAEYVQCKLPISGEAAGQIATVLNHAAFMRGQWNLHSSESLKRLYRIQKSLAALKIDLPALIDEERTARGQESTEIRLLADMIELLEPRFPRQPGRGKPRSAAINIAQSLTRIIERAAGESLSKKEVDGFVADEMKLLGVEKKDRTHGRARVRRHNAKV